MPTTEYHAAVVHPDQSVTYCGLVDQAHVDEVRAIAALDDSPRFVKEHPRQAGAFFVLRDDGDLDWYEPVGAEPFVVRAPDQASAVEGTGSEPMGVAGPAYIDGVERLGDQSIGGAMDHPESGPRFTWHVTVSPSGSGYFDSMASYLIRSAVEPQVIYDPASDRLGQFGPLTQSARALKNDGTRRTNREGRVNIQVEVCAMPSPAWTKGFDLAKKPNFRKLLAAGRAHGIPDDWPAGPPVASPSAAMPRNRAIWQSKAGHYGHCHVPGNDHWDPGSIDTAIVPGTAATPTPVPPSPTPAPQPSTHLGDRGTLGTWPGSPPVRYGYRNDKVRAMQLRLRQAVGSAKAKQLNPSGATGYYGTETQALVRYALRNHPETWNQGAASHDGNVGRLSWAVIDKL